MPERNRKTIWRCMSKDEISYQILYRYSLEKLYSTLTRRVDNVLSFALVFLGVGVTINVGSPFILGPGIVGIAILKSTPLRHAISTGRSAVPRLAETF